MRHRYDARRLDILSAASKTFRTRGFAATGMREIADVAGLSSGVLYHYFKGKQELLYFCQDHSLEKMLAALRQTRISDKSAADKLRIVIDAHVRCILDEIEGSVAHLEVDGLPAILRRRLLAKRDRYERGIRRLVAAGIESGQFVACNPKLATLVILGALNWTARWFRPEGDQSAREIAVAFADYLIRGLEKRKGVEA
jgi:AcrR family transcriptional regulator